MLKWMNIFLSDEYHQLCYWNYDYVIFSSRGFHTLMILLTADNLPTPKISEMFHC